MESLTSRKRSKLQVNLTPATPLRFHSLLNVIENVEGFGNDVHIIENEGRRVLNGGKFWRSIGLDDDKNVQPSNQATLLPFRDGGLPSFKVDYSDTSDDDESSLTNTDSLDTFGDDSDDDKSEVHEFDLEDAQGGYHEGTGSPEGQGPHTPKHGNRERLRVQGSHDSEESYLERRIARLLKRKVLAAQVSLKDGDSASTLVEMDDAPTGSMTGELLRVQRLLLAAAAASSPQLVQDAPSHPMERQHSYKSKHSGSPFSPDLATVVEGVSDWTSPDLDGKVEVEASSDAGEGGVLASTDASLQSSSMTGGAEDQRGMRSVEESADAAPPSLVYVHSLQYSGGVMPPVDFVQAAIRVKDLVDYMQPGWVPTPPPDAKFPRIARTPLKLLKNPLVELPDWTRDLKSVLIQDDDQNEKIMYARPVEKEPLSDVKPVPHPPSSEGYKESVRVLLRDIRKSLARRQNNGKGILRSSSQAATDNGGLEDNELDELLRKYRVRVDDLQEHHADFDDSKESSPVPPIDDAELLMEYQQWLLRQAGSLDGLVTMNRFNSKQKVNSSINSERSSLSQEDSSDDSVSSESFSVKLPMLGSFQRGRPGGLGLMGSIGEGDMEDEATPDQRLDLEGRKLTIPSPPKVVSKKNSNALKFKGCVRKL